MQLFGGVTDPNPEGGGRAAAFGGPGEHGLASRGHADPADDTARRVPIGPRSDHFRTSSLPKSPAGTTCPGHPCIQVLHHQQTKNLYCSYSRRQWVLLAPCRQARPVPAGCRSRAGSSRSPRILCPPLSPTEWSGCATGTWTRACARSRTEATTPRISAAPAAKTTEGEAFSSRVRRSAFGADLVEVPADRPSTRRHLPRKSRPVSGVRLRTALARQDFAAQPDTGLPGFRVVRSDVAAAHCPQPISALSATDLTEPGGAAGTADRSEPVPRIRRRRAPARGPAS